MSIDDNTIPKTPIRLNRCRCRLLEVFCNSATRESEDGDDATLINLPPPARCLIGMNSSDQNSGSASKGLRSTQTTDLA